MSLQQRQWVTNGIESEFIQSTVSSMIFLSKDGKDEYINMFAVGCGAKPTDTELFDYSMSSEPIVLRGILKHKIMKQCWEDNRTFYYVDTGYFGNERTSNNPSGWKYWHRIVKNDLQHKEIILRPDDRFKKFNKKFSPWKKDGRKILVAAPDEKPCKFYGITKDEWVKQTVETIKNTLTVLLKLENVQQNVLIELPIIHYKML